MNKRSRYYNEYIDKIIYYKGQLFTVLDVYEGDEDQSWHGTPWYYDYIVLKNIKTNDVITLNTTKEKFKIATEYVGYLKEKLNEAKKEIDYITTEAKIGGINI
nr:MAG TPA: hypothetical protein [Caudoviricetes sp.]